MTYSSTNKNKYIILHFANVTYGFKIMTHLCILLEAQHSLTSFTEDLFRSHSVSETLSEAWGYHTDKTD